MAKRAKTSKSGSGSKKKVAGTAAKKKATTKKVAKKKTSTKKVATTEMPESPPKKQKKKKSPYTKRQLNPVRAALLELRHRVVGDLNMMEGESARSADSEVDTDDAADQGSDAFDRDMTLNLMANDARRLQSIDAALEAMDARTFGLCEECEESIPLVRLQALPFARMCVPCQERRERLG